LKRIPICITKDNTNLRNVNKQTKQNVNNECKQNKGHINNRLLKRISLIFSSLPAFYLLSKTNFPPSSYNSYGRRRAKRKRLLPLKVKGRRKSKGRGFRNLSEIARLRFRVAMDADSAENFLP
jgi:hypothetical protein